MDSVIKQLEPHFKKLIKDFSKGDQEKAWLAFQRSNEYLLRLKRRYNELLKIEREIVNSELGKTLRSLNDMQLDFVDKTEGFHQHVYSCVSAFIMLLNHIAKKDFKTQIPINSVEEFLRFLGRKSYSSVIKDQVHYLEKSVDFRNKFIDHPQQHALHDWMTYTYPGGCVVIYFIRRGNEVYYRGLQINPYSPDFEPPVNYKSFYISPPHVKVYDAVKRLVVLMAEQLAQD